MTTLDLIPGLRRRGCSIQKSGSRLAADLQTVRELANRFSALLSHEYLAERPAEVDLAQNLLDGVLTDLDGIDPDDPPGQEALDFLSHRARLAINLIQLVLSQESIAILEQHLTAPGHTPH